ncbi:hypothetical protein M426DRAFT_256748 [Hypoxylon sp. CI-4A]|nr:hypothetical protein M426DRAFT_256748 [Hypoxylon sp. CI-4A]
MFFKLLTLAAATTAATIPRDALVPSAEYIWQVTSWQAGLSHGNPEAPITAWYAFSISAAEFGDNSSHIPAFAARCTGDADGRPLSSNLSSCSFETTGSASESIVSARVLPNDEFSQAHIAVYYVLHSDDETKTTRNFTVTIVEDWARERPPHNFTVKPDEVEI